MCDARVVTDAATWWAEALAEWAIPADILDRAPESPWSFPVPLFAHATRHALESAPSPSRLRALEGLPDGGSVLDVGTGAGAAAVPLAPPAGLLVGVDQSAEMLAQFSAAGAERGSDVRTLEGRWPDMAAEAPVADVVTCHHVLYNVADLVPFAAALTRHARRRVVVELTATHPQTNLNPLWKAIHGIDRPTGPTAADAVAVLTEMGLDVSTEEFERGSLWDDAHRADMVAFTRRRLCVGPERDAEVEALLGPAGEQPARQLVTVWWPGDAVEP